MRPDDRFVKGTLAPPAGCTLDVVALEKRP
jgi:hypothetical protein